MKTGPGFRREKGDHTMRRVCVPVIVLCLFCMSAESSPQETARDIMQKQKDLHKCKSEIVDQSMVLVDKSGKKETRELRQYVKESGPGVNRVLIVFLSPADVRGTALLTWQHKDREDDQWLYLPAQGKLQRVARGGRKNYFMGTDFTYEDLENKNLDDYAYTLLREEEAEGSPCYVVEAVPASEQKLRESGYGRTIAWVARQNYATLKVEFYDRRGKLVKTQINRDWANVKGTVWRPQKMLMDNHRDEHKTLIGFTRRRLDQEIDDQVFSERFILSGKHAQ
jgi:outer membrane lipoprotein-sorting protein